MRLATIITANMGMTMEMMRIWGCDREGDGEGGKPLLEEMEASSLVPEDVASMPSLETATILEDSGEQRQRLISKCLSSDDNWANS